MDRQANKCLRRRRLSTTMSASNDIPRSILPRPLVFQVIRMHCLSRRLDNLPTPQSRLEQAIHPQYPGGNSPAAKLVLGKRTT